MFGITASESTQAVNDIMMQLLEGIITANTVKMHMKVIQGNEFVEQSSNLLQQYNPKFDRGQLHLKLHNYYNMWKLDDEPCCLVNDTLNCFAIPKVQKM